MEKNSPDRNVTQTQPDRRWLVIIIVISISLRLAAVFYLGDRVVNLPGTYDQLSYDMLAQRVLKGQGFTVANMWWPITPAGEPTAHWSYLYTLYLTGVYGLVGYHPLVARLIQAVLAGLLMPWLIYRLGHRLFNYHVGLIAAAFMALYIYFIYYAAALMTETFYIMAILAALDRAYLLLERPDRGNWLLLGLFLGLAALLRQVILLFVPFLFLWLWWQGRARLRLRDFSLAVLVIIALVLPWTIRNYQVFDRFVLLNTNAGFAFFWGNHPIYGYNFISILPDDGPTYQDLIPVELRTLNEAELDRALLKRGLAFIHEEPGRYLILSISRLEDYFKFWPSARSVLISNVSRVGSFGLFLPFMLYGLWCSRRQWPAVSLLYLFVSIYTLIHLLTWALIRYRLPVDAILLLFAGAALVEIQARLAWGRPRFLKSKATISTMLN